jgi:hypothetical protein
LPEINPYKGVAASYQIDLISVLVKQGLTQKKQLIMLTYIMSYLLKW